MVHPLKDNPLFGCFVVLVFAPIVSCSRPNSIQVFRPFDGPANLELPGVAQTAGLCIADLDKDGRPDLVALSGATARLKVLLDRGDRYLSPVELDAGASASGCATGDFNGDGEIDVAVCHHDNDEIWLFFGVGGGTFAGPKKVHVPVTKPHAHMLLVADSNGDRVADLLLAQADDNKAWVLVGDGKGEFQPGSGSPIFTGNHPYTITASDFNGDGHLDFATPNWYGKSVSAFLGDGKGRFKEAPNSPIGGFSGPTALSAADLTGDGKIDLALGNDDSNRVQILVGDGKGAFVAGVASDLQAQADCFAPILADITGDGKLDVIATGVNDAPTLSYWINLGGGNFSPAHALRCTPVATRICVADLNGDSVPDLVVGAWDEAKIMVWFGSSATK